MHPEGVCALTHCTEADQEYYKAMIHTWKVGPDIALALHSARVRWELDHKLKPKPKPVDDYRSTVMQCAEQMARISGLPIGLMKYLQDNEIDEWDAVIEIQKVVESGLTVVVLQGHPGTGKTVAAAWELWKRILEDAENDPFFVGQTPGRFWRAHDLAMSDWFGQEAKERRQSLVRTPLLVIDDLGAEPQTSGDVWLSELEALVDARYDNQGKLTIVTTNKPNRELSERYKARTWRRLGSGQNNRVSKCP